MMDDEAFIAALARVAPELVVYAAKRLARAQELDHRKEQAAERQARYWSRLNLTSTDVTDVSASFTSPLPNTYPVKERKKVSKNPLTSQASDDVRSFDEFWELYPNKAAKPEARRAFAKALRKVSLADLIVGLRRYMVHKPADRQWLNPATFLNQERWADQPAPVEQTNGRDPKHSLSAAYQRLSEQLDEGELDFKQIADGYFGLPKG